MVASGELRTEGFACRLSLGIGHGAEQRAGLGLMFLRHRIQHIGQAIIPAPLLGELWIVLSQRGLYTNRVELGGAVRKRATSKLEHYRSGMVRAGSAPVSSAAVAPAAGALSQGER